MNRAGRAVERTAGRTAERTTGRKTGRTAGRTTGRVAERTERRATGKIIWTFNFLGIAFIVICYLLMNLKEKESGLPYGQLYFDEELSGYRGIIPNSLLGLMEKNPETKEFVLNYPVYKDYQADMNLSVELDSEGIPLFLQWDERWGYKTYGDDFMALNGCGPTCLSMVYCGLTGDDEWNPYEVAKMADNGGYYVDGAGSSWELMSSGAEEMGLTVHNVIFDGAHIRSELSKGRPIICAMWPGDFTTAGHFIVLAGEAEDGSIIVRDPNSIIRSEKNWALDILLPQIKNLWSYSY